MSGAPAADTTAALRSMLASGRSQPVPGVERDELVEAMMELHDEAVAALVTRGFPASVGEATLADIPRKVETYGDLADDDWLLTVFSGEVVTLGRLQFERGAEPQGRNLHIPENGPLDPEAVDESLAWAARTFDDGAPLICESWIFDDRLGGLSASSNLRRFVERFDRTQAAPSLDGARDLAKFVFRSTPERVVAEPLRAQASSVERIAYAALAGDGVWSKGFGRLLSA
ncbi:hypothetical protein ACFQ9V_17445 [Leifsonia sp. NPDC056665]|uniref:hypothetical protein n=1 Tax=Leifsonia sp. NPDC056665 TaxID=3345901 RepID=UPI0036B42EF3